MEQMQMQAAAGGSSAPSQALKVKRRRTPSPARRDLDADEERGGSREVTPELDEHYITTRTDVVGIQYYTGLVGRGEYVMLHRQPENQYDSNAVQVLNASGTQVGHIPRAVAGKIGPLMDGRLITVEGRMIGQNVDGSGHYKLGLDMMIYGRPSHRSILEAELAWATPGQQGFEAMRRAATQSQTTSSPNAKRGPKFKGKGRVLGGDTGMAGGGGSGAGLPNLGPVDEEMQRLLDGLRKVGEDEKLADGVMDSLTADIDVSKLSLHPSPPSVANGQLLNDLLSHQSQALQWMTSREKPQLPATASDAPVQFWVRQKPSAKTGGTKDYWLNVATKTPQTETPTLGKGGIIADGMGLGKTLIVLCLIIASKGEQPTHGASSTTLIVCPLSVLSNWEKQIRDHIAPGVLTFHTYHGEGRGVTAVTLSQYDVVLTTYQTVAAEVSSESLRSTTPVKAKKAKVSAGPLFKVQWKRLVADEGHVLRNSRAKMTQAFAALQADRRWVCTGTPIVNSPADLGSLLTCMKLCKPLDQQEYFKSLLLRPLKNGEAAAGKLLQALVGQILLRRTKETRDRNGKRIVDLPPVEFFQVPVRLDDDTRSLYDELLAISARRFEQAMRTGEVGTLIVTAVDLAQSTASVLSMLTRMRQLCLSAELVPESFIEEMRQPPPAVDKAAVAVASISPEEQEKLSEKLRRIIADEEECGVCLDIIDSKEPAITDCGHAFCYTCIFEVIARAQGTPSCPMDRHPIGITSLLQLPPDSSDYVQPNEEAKAIKSAKIEEVIKYLKVFDPADKTLVFSQFTSFLDHVATALRKEGIAFCRFDGSMSAKKRQEVIESFQTPVTPGSMTPNPIVMLISLKSGAVGLNLTTASNVFLCDPWWQSAIEAQAVDRVHRMGQRKTVRVFQLIAENTIEAKVLDIQKRKDALVAKAFEKSSKGETAQAKRQARFEELKELLGVH